MTLSSWDRDAFLGCEPFELQRVDFVMDKLKKRREFRLRAHVGRGVSGESFF